MVQDELDLSLRVRTVSRELTGIPTGEGNPLGISGVGGIGAKLFSACIHQLLGCTGWVLEHSDGSASWVPRRKMLMGRV